VVSKPAVFGLLAAGCIVAAAGGAYVAVRDAASPAAVVPSSAPAQPEAAAAASGSETVVPVEDTAPARTAPAEKNMEPASDERRPTSPAQASERRSAARARASGRASAARAPAAVEPPASAPSAPPPAPSDPPQPPAVAEPERSAPPVESGFSRTDASRLDSGRTDSTKTYDELVVSADSVIGLQMETTVTSERARVEDRVEARVTRDVNVGTRTAIPAGARVIGSVALVERGGKIKERARLGIRFHTLVLADGTEIPVETSTIYRDGESPARESTAKIGGAAVGGAILGAILGGTKGAIVGGTTGAAGGTAAVMAGDRNPAILAAGSNVTVRLSSPVTVTVER
jgi:hypothetical protein